jgi:two-component system response regulator DevR
MESVLVVEDDPVVAACIQREVRAFAKPIHASTVAAALEVIDRDPSLRAVTIDLHLPDGSGLRLLQEIRSRRPGLKCLVLTGERDPQHVNGSHLLDAEFAYKPEIAPNLRHFLNAVAGPGRAVDQFASDHRLSPRERQILELAVQDVPRSELHVRLSVSPNTVKSQIRSILRKSGIRSLQTLARQLRRGV